MWIACLSTALAGTSALWGTAGEAWDPQGRVPDVSQAGYRAGEDPPEVETVADAASMGVTGDGVTDDTAALQAALDATQDGALILGPGTYRVSDVLRIDHSVVLRGAGPAQTRLSLGVSLSDVLGPAEQWSWLGGFVHVEPPSAPTLLTPTIGSAIRGESRVQVEDPSGVAPGDLVVLRYLDPGDRSLPSFLHAGHHDGGDCTWQQSDYTVEWPVRIEAVEGTTLVLAQPLRIDVRPEWAVEVRSAPFLTDVGIEGLTIAFDEVPPADHLEEPGRNGIFFVGGVADSWVRDVAIEHADNGVVLDHLTKSVTVSGITLSGRPGHHGISLAFTADTLVQDVMFQADFIHGVTLDHRANGNVFRRLDGPAEVALDHHRDASFDNLFTAIDATTTYFHGGSLCAGPPSGARSVSWGLAGPVTPPYFGFVMGTVVGDVDSQPLLTEDAEWYEPVDDLDPRDLYEAMRTLRRDGLPPDAPPAVDAKSGCGCATGGTPTALLPLVWLYATRRKRPPRMPTPVRTAPTTVRPRRSNGAPSRAASTGPDRPGTASRTVAPAPAPRTPAGPMRRVRDTR